MGRRILLSLVVAIALLVGLRSTGCTLLTRFQSTNIQLIPEELPREDVSVYLPFSPVPQTTRVVLGIYDKVTAKDTYQYYYTLRGDIDEITSIKVTLRTDRGKIVELPIALEVINGSKVKDKDSHFRFPTGPHELQLESDDFETVTVTSNVTGLRLGKPQTFEVVNRLPPRHSGRVGKSVVVCLDVGLNRRWLDQGLATSRPQNPHPANLG